MELTDSDSKSAMVRDRVKHAANFRIAERILAGLRRSDLSMQAVEVGIRHQNPEAMKFVGRPL